MLLRTFSLAVFAAVLAGCGPLITAPASRPQADARAAVAGLVQDYESPRNEAFFDRLDAHAFPNFEQFRDNVRQFQIENREITLDVIVDGVDENGDAVGVRSHWNKSYVDAKGMHKLKNGQCELVFRRAPSGGLLLTSIQGTSPF